MTLKFLGRISEELGQVPCEKCLLSAKLGLHPIDNCVVAKLPAGLNNVSSLHSEVRIRGSNIGIRRMRLFTSNYVFQRLHRLQSIGHDPR